MSTYIDTALFVNAFVLETDSPEAIWIFDGAGEPVLGSHLHQLEIPSAIRPKRFRGEITQAQETAAVRSFRAEVDAGRFERMGYELLEGFEKAEMLSSRYGAETGARSLDLWPVAAALEAGCTAFASDDARPRRVAARCGLAPISATPSPARA